jgi:hypothetical protein
MAGRVPDRSPETETGTAPPEAERPDGLPEPADEAAERKKAETEIAAGDVADDLADFA